MSDFNHIADLCKAAEPPTEGILSRTLHQDDRVKVVVFGFGAGQELSEHTSALPAMLQVLQGEGEFVLGGRVIPATPGSWVHMPPGLPHSVRATSPMVMLLTLLRNPTAS